MLRQGEKSTSWPHCWPQSVLQSSKPLVSISSQVILADAVGAFSIFPYFSGATIHCGFLCLSLCEGFLPLLSLLSQYEAVWPQIHQWLMSNPQPTRDKSLCVVSVSLSETILFLLYVFSQKIPLWGSTCRPRIIPFLNALFIGPLLFSAHCCTFSLQESVFTKTKLLWSQQKVDHGFLDQVFIENRKFQTTKSNAKNPQKTICNFIIIWSQLFLLFFFFFAVHLSFGSNVVRQPGILERASEEKYTDKYSCLGHHQSVI